MSVSQNDIRNLARGGMGYHQHRRAIARQWLGIKRPRVEPLSSFLADSFFGLEGRNWTAFNFGTKDWEICARLINCRNDTIEANYLDFVLYYVRANAQSVQRIIDANQTMSINLLAHNIPDITPLGLSFTSLEQQSLFSFRAEAASQNASADKIRSRLTDLFSNVWCKARLLYPLIYKFVTPDASLDKFLAYVVTGLEHDTERVALQLLLCDETARHSSLAFKAYIGLMGHPYDALNFMLDHIELELVSPQPLKESYAGFLASIAELFPESRGARLAGMALRQDIDFVRTLDKNALARWLPLEQRQLDFLIEYCSLDPTQPASSDMDAGRPAAILANMRCATYPVPEDFIRITHDRAAFFFIDGAHLLGALLRAIYMVQRCERDLEKRDALRLVSFLGGINPFVASTPSALDMVEAMQAHGRGVKIAVPQLIERTADTLGKKRPFQDRLWINDFQWRLHMLERKGKLRQWLALVRAEARIKPSFLTGINWQWVDEMIQIFRIDPFSNFEGGLLFLLMDFEAPNVDESRLTLALEDLIAGRALSEMVVILIREYGSDAIAFVRRFLTIDNLLVFGVAPTVFAAISMRLEALERCLVQSGFGPLMTEDMYASEAKVLTSELLLQDVNVGKFEVPWDLFRRDMIERQYERYLAFSSLAPGTGEETQFNAQTEMVHIFPNGRIAVYRFRLYQNPLYAFVLAVIQGFMEHPAYGLEVILSARFRHSNLLQEIWSAIASVESATIPGIPVNERRNLARDYRSAVENMIERWCSEFMQTKRDEKRKGLFDIVPQQKDLDELLQVASGLSDHAAVIDLVIDWMQERLKGQIENAGRQFVDDTQRKFQVKFEAIRERQYDSTSRRADVSRMHSAISTAVTRKIEQLANWFGGIDIIPSSSMTLYDLALATERLFVDMIADKKLKVRLDRHADLYQLEPSEVKLAFDMLREIFYNALKQGCGPIVQLRMSRARIGEHDGFVFTNRASRIGRERGAPVPIQGYRYQSQNAAVLLEGNSGRLKIASSAATLLGQETYVLAVERRGFYHLLVPFSGKKE